MRGQPVHVGDRPVIVTFPTHEVEAWASPDDEDGEGDGRHYVHRENLGMFLFYTELRGHPDYDPTSPVSWDWDN